MELIIGGAYQGKVDYVCKAYGIDKTMIADGKKASQEEILKAKAIKNFHEWIRQSMLANQQPSLEILEILKINPELIIITDEVGNGIIPLEHFDRRWREEVGRVCCDLVKQAERVTRVMMGIPLCIKEPNK